MSAWDEGKSAPPTPVAKAPPTGGATDAFQSRQIPSVAFDPHRAEGPPEGGDPHLLPPLVGRREERGEWRELWIVDPIDGTKEFIKRNGEFTVNIALVRDGVPVLGVIYVPVSGELYVGTAGEGAVKAMYPADGAPDAQKAMEGATSIPVAKADRPYTAVASRSHMSAETEEFIAELRKEHGDVALISKGSSLKLCMVAEGKADCYPRFAPTMEWDTAAGQAICMAAGFDVIDQNTGETMRYNREDLLNAWFLVK